jgi:hypothetical protein
MRYKGFARLPKDFLKNYERLITIYSLLFMSHPVTLQVLSFPDFLASMPPVALREGDMDHLEWWEYKGFSGQLSGNRKSKRGHRGALRAPRWPLLLFLSPERWHEKHCCSQIRDDPWGEVSGKQLARRVI